MAGRVMDHAAIGYGLDRFAVADLRALAAESPSRALDALRAYEGRNDLRRLVNAMGDAGYDVAPFHSLFVRLDMDEAACDLCGRSDDHRHDASDYWDTDRCGRCGEMSAEHDSGCP